MFLTRFKTVFCALSIVTLALMPVASSAQMRPVTQQEQEERERKRKEAKQQLAEQQAAATTPAAKAAPASAGSTAECMPDGTTREFTVDVNTLEDIFGVRAIDAATLISSAQPGKADVVQWRPVTRSSERDPAPNPKN